MPEHRLVKPITSYGVPSPVSIGEWHNPPPSCSDGMEDKKRIRGPCKFFYKIVSKRFCLKVSGLEGKGRG